MRHLIVQIKRPEGWKQLRATLLLLLNLSPVVALAQMKVSVTGLPTSKSEIRQRISTSEPPASNRVLTLLPFVHTDLNGNRFLYKFRKDGTGAEQATTDWGNGIARGFSFKWYWWSLAKQAPNSQINTSEIVLCLIYDDPNRPRGTWWCEHARTGYTLTTPEQYLLLTFPATGIRWATQVPAVYISPDGTRRFLDLSSDLTEEQRAQHERSNRECAKFYVVRGDTLGCTRYTDEKLREIEDAKNLERDRAEEAAVRSAQLQEWEQARKEVAECRAAQRRRFLSDLICTKPHTVDSSGEGH